MIGVLGSGSWATAIVKILIENATEPIRWWIREEPIIEGLKADGHNPLYLPEIFFDIKKIKVSTDINEVVAECDDVYVVIPSAFVGGAMKNIAPENLVGKNFISAVKGIEPESNLIVTDYMNQKLGIPEENMAIVSGPSHAEETARKKLTFLTVASSNDQLVDRIRGEIENKFVHTTPSNDMRGIQFSTVLKNIYAVAAGIFRGLGYGDNLTAVLVSNAAQEIEAFIQKLVPMPARQLAQYAYLGDLLVTCYSQHSRNRTFGRMLGMGYGVKEAQMEMQMIAEGYYAVACFEKIRKEIGFQMPIEETVYGILYHNEIPSTAVEKLLHKLH